MSAASCWRCGRARQSYGDPLHGIGKCQPAVGVYAVHAFYGCDSGCCGHQYCLMGGDNDVDNLEFEFTHERADIKAELDAYAREYKCPILWDRCEIRENCY